MRTKPNAVKGSYVSFERVVVCVSERNGAGDFILALKTKRVIAVDLVGGVFYFIQREEKKSN